MKWMGGWSYSELCEAPVEHVRRIIDLINEEAERLNDI